MVVDNNRLRPTQVFTNDPLDWAVAVLHRPEMTAADIHLLFNTQLPASEPRDKARFAKWLAWYQTPDYKRTIAREQHRSAAARKGYTLNPLFFLRSRAGPSSIVVVLLVVVLRPRLLRHQLSIGRFFHSTLFSHARRISQQLPLHRGRRRTTTRTISKTRSLARASKLKKQRDEGFFQDYGGDFSRERPDCPRMDTE